MSQKYVNYEAHVFHTKACYELERKFCLCKTCKER